MFYRLGAIFSIVVLIAACAPSQGQIMANRLEHDDPTVVSTAKSEFESLPDQQRIDLIGDLMENIGSGLGPKRHKTLLYMVSKIPPGSNKTSSGAIIKH